MILDCNEIVPERLWVGSYVRPQDIGFLQKLQITAIVNLQSDWDLASYNIPMKKLLAAYAAADIRLHRIPVPDFDRQALATHLPEAVATLEEILTPRWSKAYVHCTAGINRGPTLAAAYLIKKLGMTAREAYDYVVARRECKPYLEALLEYEASLSKPRVLD